MHFQVLHANPDQEFDDEFVRAADYGVLRGGCGLRPGGHHRSLRRGRRHRNHPTPRHPRRSLEVGCLQQNENIPEKNGRGAGERTVKEHNVCI